MKRAPMTVAGAERLRGELTRLKNEERPRVISAIAEARAHGDLKENAVYHAAKEQQGFIEGRIAELEGSLATAELIDPTITSSRTHVSCSARRRSRRPTTRGPRRRIARC